MLYISIIIFQSVVIVFMAYVIYKFRKYFYGLLDLIRLDSTKSIELFKSLIEVDTTVIDAVKQLRLRLATIELLFLQNTPAPFVEKPLPTITKVSGEESFFGEIIDEDTKEEKK